MSCVRMRVASSDWCASRMVVSVTRTLRSCASTSELFRPVAVEPLLRSSARGLRRRCAGRGAMGVGFALFARLRVAVHGHVGNVVQKLCGSVAPPDRND